MCIRDRREALDKAGEQDGKHYMLTIAAPSSGYLLRGMETFQTAQYLDFVNIMTYDLHGAWNDHVGHNAPLYDTGKDTELKTWNVYNTKEFGGIGYLNTDWAVNYFRGTMPAGRINIGIPYYTRGFKDVRGGENGLWGRAPLPNQSDCPKGTGIGEKNKCGKRKSWANRVVLVTNREVFGDKTNVDGFFWRNKLVVTKVGVIRHTTLVKGVVR